ncbi:predicted protein [Botrytis cinerea T4]|uniref:Uncharacterized protein n=1 Tax=Botryotinia fuckeliana (strain T4) TaxID=999810 RepID=G2Y2Z9_BOTF4|nr:predicted protein [Botrytis cinerea T4]
MAIACHMKDGTVWTRSSRRRIPFNRHEKQISNENSGNMLVCLKKNKYVCEEDEKEKKGKEVKREKSGSKQNNQHNKRKQASATFPSPD